MREKPRAVARGLVGKAGRVSGDPRFHAMVLVAVIDGIGKIFLAERVGEDRVVAQVVVFLDLARLGVGEHAVLDRTRQLVLASTIQR